MKLLFLSLFIYSFYAQATQASCSGPVDLLVVGDSQVGATWSKSYLGNFLPGCLKGNFIIYGRGGSVPGNWLGNGGMDQIETIQRDHQEEHLNLGAGKNVPLCQKRIGPMLEAHTPRKVLFEFGGNYISVPNEIISSQINQLMETVAQKGISPENCYFLNQTYEMEVSTKRNVPLKDLKNIKRIAEVITKAIDSRCQILSGLDIMKDSPYFDGKELLKRVQVDGRSGCSGAAVNDNAHVCGAAAKDFAERICSLFNQI